MPRGSSRATPDHGTLSRYKNHGCTCESCTRANRLYDKLRTLEGVPRLISPIGTRRRIRALQAIGWSTTALGAELGVVQATVSKYMDHGKTSRATARKIAALYERLSMTPRDDSIPGVVRTKRHAERQGWAPPLAWDDIDNPDEAPDMGARAGGADPLEWKWLVDGGEDPTRAAERLGVAMTTIAKTARRKGLHDIARLAERYRERTAA